jgi:hypothetical protein
LFFTPREAAILVAEVVLPTPPFWFAKAIIFAKITPAFFPYYL